MFISWAKPHGPVSRDRFSRWVKLVLGKADIDTCTFSSHSTCVASMSAVVRRGSALSAIVKAAGWSIEWAFAKFYSKVTASQNFGQMLLDKFVHIH